MIDAVIFRRLMKLIVWLVLSYTAYGQAEELMTFSSPVNQTRYDALVKELRCPKCQNQDIADSGSGIAKDLRHKIHDMIENGQSDKEIVDYMVARYGDFVLYRPKHNAATFALWYGPFILLGVGLVIFAVVIIRNRLRRKGETI
ncbi:cytochrome c-type biogenesis protein [Marinomonas spartinae]|uniref:cytochrome c-type biogenesis protein n=1 Tax=Marinomonas spartinae TaxID=1792290 RepID=UPI001F30FF70|nr:cytochrome c-type biogenesis protein [Marinomonas spartinae]